MICYLFPETRQELDELRQIALDTRDERILFALPQRPIRIYPSIQRWRALVDIQENLDAITQDPRAGSSFTAPE